mmetsp:Transcript_95214/g.238673  ORF Transcript_95214/g.238673 Transcript_95214/m.238673 type:complete len:344 (+) Transcript_95214:126-1157(+)
MDLVVLHGHAVAVPILILWLAAVLAVLAATFTPNALDLRTRDVAALHVGIAPGIETVHTTAQLQAAPISDATVFVPHTPKVKVLARVHLEVQLVAIVLAVLIGAINLVDGPIVLHDHARTTVVLQLAEHAPGLALRDCQTPTDASNGRSRVVRGVKLQVVLPDEDHLREAVESETKLLITCWEHAIHVVAEVLAQRLCEFARPGEGRGCQELEVLGDGHVRRFLQLQLGVQHATTELVFEVPAHHHSQGIGLHLDVADQEGITLVPTRCGGDAAALCDQPGDGHLVRTICQRIHELRRPLGVASGHEHTGQDRPEDAPRHGRGGTRNKSSFPCAVGRATLLEL